MAAALAAVALTACADAGSRQPVPLFGEAFATSRNAAELNIGVASCNGDPTFELTETDQTITIAVESWIPGGDSADCLDSITAKLDQPIGDRSIVDEVSGQTVELVTDSDQSADSLARVADDFVLDVVGVVKVEPATGVVVTM